MDSINRQVIVQRIGGVYDTAIGAQGTSKGLKSYVKDLRKAVGLKDEAAGSSKDFLRDIGGGI
jgi:hypothetical protein